MAIINDSPKDISHNFWLKVDLKNRLLQEEQAGGGTCKNFAPIHISDNFWRKDISHNFWPNLRLKNCSLPEEQAGGRNYRH